MVPVEGIEPTLLAEHDFESCASTNSATRAGSAIIAAQGKGSTWGRPHAIATSAPYMSAPYTLANFGIGTPARNGAATWQHDRIPPRSLGCDRHCSRGRRHDCRRLVLPIRARACSLPALSRAALCLLFRGAARLPDRAR